MHNTTEIEKSLENYPLIQMNDIEDEARLLAVRWVEGYERAGFDLPNKHKLASDIMNYAIRQFAKQSNFEAFAIESIKENERIHQQIGDIGKLPWVKASDRKPENFWDVHVRIVQNENSEPYPFTGDKEELLSMYYPEQIEWIDESPTDKPEELQEEVERLRTALRGCISACEYAANDFDAGYTLADNVIGTSSPVGSLLIAARNARNILKIPPNQKPAKEYPKITVR